MTESEIVYINELFGSKVYLNECSITNLNVLNIYQIMLMKMLTMIGTLI